MAHNIMDNKRFYSLRKPAWHGLGHVSQTEHTIVEASNLVGLPEIHRRPVFFKGNVVDFEIPDRKAIVGYTKEHGPVAFAIVSNQYQITTHQDIVSAYHTILEAKPVETLGVLGKGETMFVTTHLPMLNVNGDQIKPYLMIVNTIDGKTALKARVVSTRVVCQNTLMMSMGETTDYEINIAHRGNPLAVIRDWLADTYAKTQGALEVIREAGETLASKALSHEEMQTLLQTYEPLPEDIHSTAYAKQSQHHDNVMSLVLGSPTLRDDQRFNAWGAYNAIVEYEDFARARTTRESQVFGTGAKRKQRAFDTLLAMSQA